MALAMGTSLDALRQQASDELQLLLSREASAFPGLRWVMQALEAPGKLLSPKREGFEWALLPLLVVEAVGSEPRTALPLAVAADLLVTASDVFDDIQDGDSPSSLERSCGLPTAINVGILLACMAQLAVHRLSDLGTPAPVVRNVGRALAAATARACAGQQCDIDQDDALLTEDGYLEMVQAKSGALVEGLCRAAAILAGAAPELAECYAQFGRKLGMALQVSNDVRAISARPDRDNDLVVAKRTLPLVFALRQAPATAHRLATSARASALRPQQAREFAELLHATGGVLYASVVADVFFEEALACLDAAGCATTSRLRTYLTALHHD
jgi:geranylgeranyl diphosphate synthase type I